MTTQRNLLEETITTVDEHLTSIDVEFTRNEVRNDQVNSTTRKCAQSKSIVISEYRRFNNGSLLSLKDNLLYFPELFWEDHQKTNTFIRGCVCLLKKCIQKCCPQGQALGPGYKCSVSNSSILHPSKETFPDVSEFETHHVLHGKPICSEERIGIVLERSEFLVRSGELIMLGIDGRFPTEEFCLEMLENTNNIVSLLCIDRSKPESLMKALFPIAMLISSASLIFTLVVYVVLPGLRNTPGICLMSYMTSLTVSYISLSTVQLASQHLPPSMCSAIGKFKFLQGVFK